ncbi:hypothetical protein FXO37_05614 [Capsicum annuum]|nr:hypothetical protein FXO37_05614 [Capsicum annuum]
MADNHSSSGPPSIHFCFFFLVLFMFVSITWYINYESIFEGIMDQFKFILMLSPLVLLLVVHLLSSFEKALFFIPLPEQDSFHRAGGTPWGVGLLLVLLLFMISYHTDLRERWRMGGNFEMLEMKIIYQGDPIRRNSSYDEFVASLMQNETCRATWPILRINVVERYFERPLNSSAPPPRRPTVDDDLIDDDLNDYENDVDDTINMEDYSMHMEDFSLDSQDDEEDRETESQAGHSFTDGTNFCCGQTFADRKELKMQLDAAAVRQSFDYYMEKSCTKLMKAQCLSRGCGSLLREKKSSYFIMVNRIDGSFIYYFLAFGACIRGYAHMRKLIVVDGTQLYGKFRGVLLSAVAQDTENHIFLIAFCVVDKENDASWTFFFQRLKSILEDEPDLCVISNMHISIANAFSRVYIHAHHGLCMRHLAENLRVSQHCGEHLYLFYAATKAYSCDELSDSFVELKSKCPEAAYVLENVLGFEKWSRAHFSDNRYDVMTTNIVESLNASLMDEREYPVSYIFSSIAKKFERILRDNKSTSDSLYVDNPNRVLDEYTVFGNGVTSKVNLLERTCSCQKFDLVKMSCEHAMATMRAKYGNGEDYGDENRVMDYFAWFGCIELWKADMISNPKRREVHLGLVLKVDSQGHKPIMGRSQLICTGGSLMVTVQYSNDYKDDKNQGKVIE